MNQTIRRNAELDQALSDIFEELYWLDHPEGMPGVPGFWPYGVPPGPSNPSLGG